MKAAHLLEVLNMEQDLKKSPNPWLFSVKDSSGKVHLLCRDEIRKSLKEQTVTTEGAEFLRTCKLDNEFLTADQIFELETKTVNGITKKD